MGTQADDTVFRAMFDCAPDALLAVEEGGQIVQANRNAETVFGYRPDELIGQPLELLIPEAAQAAHAGHMRNYFSKPAPRSMGQELELSARRKDGTEFPVNVSLNTVRIGDRIVALAAVRDVTEKMRTRQALRKSENRLRSVFDNIQDAIFICDPETSKIVEANHRACSLLGYTREELLAQPISALHPDDLEDVQTLFSTALRGKTALTEELTCCAKSGAKFPIEVTASPLDPTGESGAHMVMAIVKDISERREAEGTLRRSEERFSKMFRTSPLPISLARVSDGIILDVNEQFCFTSGFERDEVVGKSVFDLNLLTDPEQRQNLVETLQTDGHVHGLDVTMRRKDGEHRSLLYSAEIVEVDDVPCVLASALDITERKAAEEALRLSEERFSKAVSATGDGVAISTIAEGRLLDVNDAFCRVSGYTREELVGRTALELNIWPEMKQREALMREMQAAGSVRDLEVTLRAKDGTQRTILFAGDFIAHEGQKCILGIGKDITDRKNSEEELRRSADRFRRLLEALPVAARVIQNKEIVFANTADARMYGYAEPGDILGRRSLDFIAPHERERVGDIIMRRVQGDSTLPEGYETTGLRSDGAEFPVAISGTVITYEDAPAALVVLQDLTEQRRLRMYESILPVCSTCGKVRDDSETEHGKGVWNTLEKYISDHTDTALSHTFCPVCLTEYRESQGLPAAPRPTKH